MHRNPFPVRTGCPAPRGYKGYKAGTQRNGLHRLVRVAPAGSGGGVGRWHREHNNSATGHTSSRYLACIANLLMLPS